MFNNCDSRTNGEYVFFMNIRDKIDCIFDVGCRTDSEFVNFTGEVHYFDPVSEFIEELKKNKNVKNVNKAAYFNNFGLGAANGTEIITDFSDHYQYCNIVCVNKSCILPLF